MKVTTLSGGLFCFLLFHCISLYFLTMLNPEFLYYWMEASCIKDVAKVVYFILFLWKCKKIREKKLISISSSFSEVLRMSHSFILLIMQYKMIIINKRIKIFFILHILPPRSARRVPTHIGQWQRQPWSSPGACQGLCDETSSRGIETLSSSD